MEEKTMNGNHCLKEVVEDMNLEVLLHLVALGVYTRTDWEDINSIQKPSAQRDKIFLDMVKRPHGFTKLCEALKGCGQIHLAEKLQTLLEIKVLKSTPLLLTPPDSTKGGRLENAENPNGVTRRVCDMEKEESNSQSTARANIAATVDALKRKNVYDDIREKKRPKKNTAVD